MSNIKEVELNYENRVHVGESYLFIEDNILHVVTIGDSDAENALKMKEASAKIREKFGVLNVFADINKAGKSSPEARKVWKELSEATNAKIALVGLHPVAKVLASFSMAVSGNKTTRFFTTKEEALKWLKM